MDKRIGAAKSHGSWDELNAYIGSELAAILNRFNDLSQRWTTDMFIGNRHLDRLMARTRFKENPASIWPYPYYHHGTAAKMPLLAQ